MKKYSFLVVFLFFLLVPMLVKGARTCSPSGTNYKAEVKIDKEVIGINEKAFLTIITDDDFDVTYEVQDTDLASVSRDGIIKPLKDGKTSIVANIDFLDGDEIKNSCSLTIPISVVSNDSSLKSLNLEELDISELFQKDKYDYVINLPYKYDKINIIAEASNENAVITGDGRRYLNEGDNEYKVIVTASDGTRSTYTIKIIREEANDDSSLKNLIIEGFVLEPKFSPDIFKYSLDIPNDVNEITVKAEPNYENTTVKGTGTFTIPTGKNIYYLTVTAENGNETRYELDINKNKGNSILKNLVVEGYNLDPSFNSEKYIYSITVKNDVTKLNIKAESNSKVEIIGNENFKTGINDVFIKVYDEEKIATTYKIEVNKLSREEIFKNEKNKNILKILLVVFILLFIIMVGLIGYFIKRNYYKKYKLKSIKKKEK